MSFRKYINKPDDLKEAATYYSAIKKTPNTKELTLFNRDVNKDDIYLELSQGGKNYVLLTQEQVSDLIKDLSAWLKETHKLKKK
jgi:hypothetical protein